MINLSLLFVAARDINTFAMNLSPAEAAAKAIEEEEEEEEDEEDEVAEEEVTEFNFWDDEEEKEKEESGQTISEQLKEAEKLIKEVTFQEDRIAELKRVPITTYRIQRIGCASHRVIL